MIAKKNMGKASPLLLVLLSLGFGFATYNLLTMVMHNKGLSSGKFWESKGGSEWFDPVTVMPDEVNGGGRRNAKFHVALTATDAPYSKWQCRIMYYCYKKMKDVPKSDMGGFTRVLHSGKPDNLMEEIPTFVVDPLPEGLDRVRTVLTISCYLYRVLFDISFGL